MAGMTLPKCDQLGQITIILGEKPVKIKNSCSNRVMSAIYRSTDSLLLDCPGDLFCILK